MKRRKLLLAPAASRDLSDIVCLVDENDGPARADQVLAVIETFIRSLAEFAEIGTKMKRRAGLRACPVPKLNKASVLFEVRADAVIVLRISYLGRNYWADLPALDVPDPIDVSGGEADPE
ncbi:MAG: hypothetical protein GC150_07505 [Rhizobiales bacterium]|nr:hypothetical protein [Hyphomicrobiales bacterium]